MEFGPHIKMTTLESGLVVITEHLPDRPVLAAQLVVRTGSLHDPRDQNGLAHFAEHMITHGIQGVSDEVLAKKWEKAGFWRQNLETRDDYTSYFATGLVKDVHAYLNDITLAIQHCAYDHGSFSLEQGRIINETQMHQSDRRWLRSFALAVGLYGDQPHGQWRGGYPEHLAAMKIDDIRAHHRRTHHPANMILIASGNWSHAEACAWAHWHVDVFPPGELYTPPRSVLRPNDVIYHDPPPSTRNTDPQIDYRVIFDGEGLSIEQRAAMWMVRKIMNDKLSEWARKSKVYGLNFQSKDIGTDVYELTGSSIPYSRFRDVLSEVMGVMAMTCDSITKEDVAYARTFIQKAQMLTHHFKEADLDDRAETMRSGYFRENDPLMLLKTTAALEYVTQDSVVQAIRGILSRSVSTFYWGDVEGRDFPSGAELSNILRRGLGVSSAPSAPQPGPSPV